MNLLLCFSIMPCISDHIKKEGILLWILVRSDSVSDLVVFVGYCDLYSWSSDFALYIWPYLIDKHHTVDTCSVLHSE